MKIPLDNPLDIDEGMLVEDNTETCPICKSKQSVHQPQVGTHCYTTKYDCGTEIVSTYGVDSLPSDEEPIYTFEKRCDQPMDAVEEKKSLSQIEITYDNIDIIFMDIARSISKMSKCVSKQVGSVIVKDGRIVSIGYNGTPKGWINCDNVFDSENFDRTEHHKFSENYEIHSEMNAVLFAGKSCISLEGATLYCTLEPCMNCLKNLSQSGITRIVFSDFYDLSESYDEKTFEMLKQANITIQRLEKINGVQIHI